MRHPGVGLSARVFQTFSKCHVFMFSRFCPGLAKERILEENSKRAGVLLRGFEADLYIFKQISQYLMKSVPSRLQYLRFISGSAVMWVNTI